MTNLHVTDLAEILSQMPVPAPLSDIAPESVDLFLCASGFEPRGNSVAEFLASHNIDTRLACYLTYCDNDGENRRARRGLLRNLKRMASKVKSIDGDSTSQEFSARLGEELSHLVEASVGEGRCPIVVFDISCASTRLILRTLHVVWRYNVQLLVAYSQALTYLPAPEAYAAALDSSEESRVWEGGASAVSLESLGLEGDIRDPEFSLEYPGVHLDNLPDRVIVIAGFNGRRSKAALEYVDPALVVDHPNPRVTWIVGEPLELGDRWRLDAMLQVNGLSSGTGTDSIRIVSTLDYRETLRVLEENYLHHFAFERLTVAPMGSKMQTVGVFLFCELHPDIRAVFTRPLSHNGKGYSKGVRKVWGISFGPTVSVRGRLASVGEATLFD
jgi:hypothetical protein